MSRQKTGASARESSSMSWRQMN